MANVYGTVTIKTFHHTSTVQGLMAQSPSAQLGDSAQKDSARLRVARKTVTLLAEAGVTQDEAAEIVSGWRALNTRIYDALIRNELLLIEFTPEPMRWNSSSLTFSR